MIYIYMYIHNIHVIHNVYIYRYIYIYIYIYIQFAGDGMSMEWPGMLILDLYEEFAGLARD